MKKMYFLICFAGVMILFVYTGCTKESAVPGRGNINNPKPPNRPPEAYAGLDFTGILYKNEMTLNGYANDPDMGNTFSTTWTKIAGPACTIVSPQSLKTTVTNLIVGDYQFELLAIDNDGVTDRDTVVIKITSIQPITSPIEFFNLSWYCPMGCTIPINNVYSYLPSNTPIRVLIKPVNTALWLEVVPLSQYPNSSLGYYYNINVNNNIMLYTENDPVDSVDVRILF